jgi:hypothetical protein
MCNMKEEKVILGSLFNGNVFFQIPNIENKTTVNVTGKKNLVIFLTDVSGSMRGDYKHIRSTINDLITNSPDTIFHCLTFATNAVNHGTTGYPESLYFGRTDIKGGIALLIETVKKYINQGYGTMTVVFISDGADSYPSGLKKYMESDMLKELRGVKSSSVNIDFVCVGVGTSFPTKISMSFREHFHSGRENIPSVFLIKSTDDNISRYTLYKPQFASLAGYFAAVPEVNVLPSVSPYPWRTPTSKKAHIGTWCISKYDEDLKYIDIYGDEKKEEESGGIFNNLIEMVIPKQKKREKAANEDDDDKVNEIDDAKYKLVIVPWTLETLIDNFKQWSNKFNVMCLNAKEKADKDKIKKLAESMYDSLTHMVGLIDDDLGSDASITDYARMSCKNRLKKVLRKSNNEINKYLMIYKKVIEGEFLADLTDSELAERLAIGTATGKYTERNVKMRSAVDNEEYKKIIDEFTATLDKHRDALEDVDSTQLQDSDTIALENTCDIILEDEIKGCLQLCPNQFMLVNSVMSCVGNAFKVDRSPASAGINPYAIKIISQPIINKTVGTIAVLEFQRNKELGYNNENYHNVAKDLDPKGSAIIQTGVGSNEEINAVIPMFKKFDPHLKPFMRTKLFSLMSTWGIMRNVDTIVYESVLAGLSQVLCYCLRQPNTGSRQELLDMIDPTLELIYCGRKIFDNYYNALKSNEYHKCLVTASPKINIKCEAISKTLLFMWYGKDHMTNEHKRNIMKHIYIETIGRLCDGFEIKDMFKLDKLSTGLINNLERVITYDDLKAFGLADSLQYYTLAQYQTAIKESYAKYDDEFQNKNFDIGIKMNTEKLTKLFRYDIGDVTIDRLRQFMELYFGNNIEDEIIDLRLTTYIAISNKNSFERHCNDDLTERVHVTLDQAKDNIQNSLVKDLKSEFKKTTIERLVNSSTERYDERFMEVHKFAVPLSKSEIIRLTDKQYWSTVCKKHTGRVESQGITLENYNPESNLLRFCCMCPECPHFLDYSTKLPNHLDPWSRLKENTPAMHRACKLYYDKGVDFILDKVISGSILYKTKNKLVQYNKEDLAKLKELLVDDVSFLMERYRDISKNDITYVDQILLKDK